MNEPRRRRGRPPRDPSPQASAGRQAFHIGMRFNEHREAQLKRLVGEANERARTANVPVTVTASSMVHSWIIERLEAEITKSDADRRRKR